MNEKEYSVSEAVRRTGVPSHVLRYWEEELQIVIQRSAQGYRVYSESDVELFRKVKMLKEKGIQLKAIRVLLEENECELNGDQELREQIRGIIHSEADTTLDTDMEEPVYDVVLREETSDNLSRFEIILKQMLESVIAEQNEKLEQTLTECLKGEMEMLYLRYCEEAAIEAAASRDRKKRKSLWELFKNRQNK